MPIKAISNGVEKDVSRVPMYYKSENIMPYASEAVLSDNGITVTSDGKGSYHVNGLATADANISLLIPEFTIPVSVSSGGQGTMSLFNGKIGSSQGDSRLEFYNGSTKVDSWQLIQANRTSSTYGAIMDGKTVNKINIFIKSGISADADISPMFTNNGELPTSYEPYFDGYKDGWEVRNRFIAKGLTNPLCGIDTYKDALDLSTGIITRKIKKLVLTGEEAEWFDTTVSGYHFFISPTLEGAAAIYIGVPSTHYIASNNPGASRPDNSVRQILSGGTVSQLSIRDDACATTDAFKSFLQQQYQNGTPVIVWYVLATPTTETTYVPSALTGTIEGFLTQSTTPSPTNPVMPTYNGVLEQDGTYSVDTGAYGLTFARDDTLTGTSSISYKGYGLPLKSVNVKGNMTKSGVETTINGTGTLTYTTDSDLIDYSITGNLTQSSTPAYDTPVYPQECGDRTINLYNDTATVTFQDAGVRYGMAMPIGTYSIRNDTENIVYDFSNNGSSRHELCQPHSTATITFYAEWGECGFFMAYNDASLGGVTIVSGSTPPDHYEPYGYTLPVSHTGTGGNTQTDPIYLSEPIRKIGSYIDEVGLSIGGVNRNIKKLVLTGDENWSRDINSGTFYTDSCTDYLCTTGVTCMCSHYVGVENAIGATSALEGISFITNPEYYRLYIKDWNFSSLEAFVAFLKGQNTNGTPVTVWYVRATPATETISMPTISNVNGVNNLYIGTTLQPADISLTYSNTGNPTPTAPIYPYEVGDRTANLFDADLAIGTINTSDGTTSQHNQRLRSDFISKLPAGTYALSANGAKLVFVYLYSTKTSYYGTTNSGWSTLPYTFTTNNDYYIRIVFRDSPDHDMNLTSVSNIMLNSGNNTFPYEPYGYFITLTNNSTPYPIYLGQTQSVRKIKKLVLTGDSLVAEYSASWGKAAVAFVPGMLSGTASDYAFAVCSHYQNLTRNDLYSHHKNGLAPSVEGRCVISDIRYTTLEDIKTFFDNQYAAGTPVTIWYVLATPVVGVMNEPLMKIGDYVDEVTVNTPISTTIGVNTLTVDTTLSPSSVSITGHIRPYIVSRTIDFTQSSYTSDTDIVGDVTKLSCYTGRKRCNVADDGTINAFYGDANYTEDGSNGQVMVYQPKFYYKFEPIVLEANTQTNGKGYHIRKGKWSVCDQPAPGFKLHPAFKNLATNKEVDYVLMSAYEGCLQNASTGVYNTTDTAGSSTDKLSSIANAKPVSGLNNTFATRSGLETCAINRGSGWHIETIQIASANQLLFMIELGANSQNKFYQGVVNITDVSSTNMAVNTGQTASLGNTSGQASGTAGQVSITYRGVENPYGNIWKFVSGVTNYGVGSNISEPYICNDFTFTENTTTGYTAVGFTTSGGNYIKAFGYGSADYDWLLMASECAGSPGYTGPVGDYQHISTSSGAYRVSRLGGGWNNGTPAGLFNWYLDHATSACNRTLSARLCYYPQE